MGRCYLFLKYLDKYGYGAKRHLVRFPLLFRESQTRRYEDDECLF